jgi:hypothetical protein
MVTASAPLEEAIRTVNFQKLLPVLVTLLGTFSEMSERIFQIHSV